MLDPEDMAVDEGAGEVSDAIAADVVRVASPQHNLLCIVSL